MGLYFDSKIKCSMYFAIPMNLTDLFQSVVSVFSCNACLSFINYKI